MTSGRLFRTTSLILVLIFSLTNSIFPASAAEPAGLISDFTAFVNSIKDGQGGVVRGVYVPELFSLKVLQQPANNRAYVSALTGVATEFKTARDAGNIGLLAHNYLAGQDFPSLKTGQEIRIVFGDGKIEYFKITKFFRYQALQPNNTKSNFQDLDSGERISASELFAKVYKGAYHVTFQTCIYKDRDRSWGRLFVIAEPFTPGQLTHN